jgi:hypothetical protein
VESILKKSILALCALTIAAGLSACGGGTSSYTIAGTVTGLQYEGLVLQNNNANDLRVNPLGLDDNNSVKNVPYSFPGEVDYGEPYSVTVKNHPQHQKCELAGGTADTAGRLTSINAVISCALVSNSIGGTITGLAADGLVLTNGSTGGTVTVSKDANGVYPTTFTFSIPVTYGQTYGVTVLPPQPAGQTCTVTNGAGTMGDNAVTSIAVNCVNNPA